MVLKYIVANQICVTITFYKSFSFTKYVLTIKQASVGHFFKR